MTRDETLRAVVSRQRRMMSMTGVLNLSGHMKCDELTHIGSQKALIELNLDGAGFTSLHTLPPQPCMKVLKADRSMIETLAGLGHQPRLAEISLIGTPVSRNENFRLSALICVGTRLSKINGTAVSKRERKMAAGFPPVAKYLVMCGWVVQYPPPSESDFKYLAKQFQVAASEADFIAPTVAVADAGVGDTTDRKDDEEEKKTGFAQKMAAILRPLGFAIRCGGEMNGDIVKAVSQICKVVNVMEDSVE